MSPAIDALADDGILFEDHISAAPWTIPAHISLLTSLWPSNHGVTASLREIQRNEGSFPVLSPSRTTLAEVLVARGYETGAFTAGDTLDPEFGYGQGFSLYETNMMKLHEGPMEEMKTWVAKRRDRPFFLFWHTFEPHAPYLGTRFLDEVLPEEQAASVREAVDRWGDKLRRGEVQPRRFRSILERRDAFELPVLEALYVGSVADTDRWVGRFLDDLRSLGLYDSSLIVLTSDHGEEFGDRSPESFFDAHGHTLWREMVRVPLIVKLPGQERAGTRVTARSRGVDVMPTILDVLKQPGSAQMQGLSLRPLWEGTEGDDRTAFVESLEELDEAKAVQQGRFKYLVRIDAEDVARQGRTFLPAPPQWRGLFDLENDPGEATNLLEHGDGDGVLRKRAASLDQLLREHVAAQSPDSREETIDPETVERLRQLGYVE